MATVERIVVGGPIEPWERLGLRVTDDGVISLRGTSIAIDESAAPGIIAWELSGLPSTLAPIDGLPTRLTLGARHPTLGEHQLGATEVDHVVIATDSIERTCAAIADATAAPLKRIREAGSIRQGFHRLGALVIEVVEMPAASSAGAQFWGLAINIADLDAAVELLGPALIGTVKDAVQPGRRIATIRREANLGLPLALMSL